MASIVFDADIGTGLVSHQSSDLNSLANAGYAFGTGGAAVVDNTTLRKLFLIVQLKLGSITPSGPAHMRLFNIRSFDGGATYEDPQSAAEPPVGVPMVQRGVFAGASAKIVIFPPLPILPGKSKLLVGNSVGVSLASSGNSLEYWFSTYANT